MAVKRIKRKLVWEETGVSEIIGTILMLSITVVLFSSIITFVGRMPAPQESFNVEVDCYIDPINPGNWSEGVKFIMVHQGGKVMDPMWIKIFITVDNTTLTRDLNDGLQDTNGDGDMGVGEYWISEITIWDADTLDSNSTFSITIIHQEKNLLVWQETLGDDSNVYSPVIIRVWIDSDLGTPEVDDPGPISYLGDFKIYAEIIDPEGIGGDQGLDVNNLWVNLSSIYGKFLPPVQLNDTEDIMDAHDDNIYVAICPAPNRTYAPVGYHYFHFSAYGRDHTPDDPKCDKLSELFPIGMIVGDNPQIVVRGDFGEPPESKKYEYIKFSNSEPINGDIITITAIIKNQGGGSAQVDVKFYDGEETPGQLIGTYDMLLHAQGERDAYVSWEASPGGVHNIIVRAEVNATYALLNDVEDEYPPDNWNSTNISVMPKILLVDDDGHLNDMGDGDTVSFMRASLEAADFNYDFVAVGAGDGPGYNYGDYPLQNYDIVIWMAGYEVANPSDPPSVLTKDSGGTDDLTNLQKYLEGNSTGGNGGSLWFISQGFWDEAVRYSELTDFAEDYLHIPSMPPKPNIPLPAELYGRSTNLVTDYYADNPINTVVRVSGTGNVWYWDNTVIPDTMIALNDSANTTVYGLTYDSDDHAGDPIVDSRILTQTWDFSRIEDTATQAQYTYKAIMWLGDITMKFTKDVAISEQTIEPKTVFFKQDVTISFVVRNNGFNDYNYSNGDNLWYLLRITDMAGIDIVIPHLERIDYLGSGNDNTLTISYSWTPEQIGYHRVVIKIDPYNYIEESNELNNEISNYLASGEMFVQYRILVVDDDGSSNNGGTNYDETQEITESLEYLNSTGTYSYETYVVNQMDDGPAFEADMNGVGLSEYNAVIWVGGEAENPLTAGDDGDMANLTKYLDIGGNLWFIGNGLWTAADEVVDFDFEQQYLKVGTVSGDQDMASTLWGVEDDYVSHGMEYVSNGDPNADIIVPALGGIGFTYQDDLMTHKNSVRYHGVGNSTIQYRAVTTPWLMSALDSNDSKAEFTFMVLRWFDKPESRIEARITNMDLWLSDTHPQLGSGYVIQATVHNTGGSLGNVLVRFIDGTTQIGSDSISVSPGETTTAEMIWVPLFAGQRTISVLVDPIAEVDEIFEWSNNNATRDVYVYFFWDDMESGGAKWAHSSTILLINGEEPLEYFYDTALDTNIITNWDNSMSENLNTITDFGFYHTMDTAFWLQEPAGGTQITGGRKPIDVVLAIDSSGSMEWDAGGGWAGYDDPDSRWYNARVAAIGFIQDLTELDRCAIYTFNGNGAVSQLRTYYYMTTDNKTNFIGALNAYDGNDVDGGTPFYDMMGDAIQYAVNNVLDPDPNLDLLSQSRNEYIIGLGDGQDTTSNRWTPQADWGTVSGGDDGYLNAPPMIYTIGVAGIDHDPAYPLAPDWSRTAPNVGSYADEYYMWHPSDTSPRILHDAGGKYGENETTFEDNVGHYYYTDDPSQLPGIFDAIYESIQIVQLEGENQTRSAGPVNEPMAVLWSDGFESGDFSNWDNSPNDWTVREIGDDDYGGQEVMAVAEGDFCANAHDSNSNWDSLEKSFGDLSGYTNRQVNYYYHVQDCENNEDIYVQIWHDGSWDTVVNHQDNNGQTRTDPGDWSIHTINLETDISVTDWTDIRLRFNIDPALETDDEFMLDDVQLTGDLGGNNPPNTPIFVSHGGDANPSGPIIGDDTPDLDWNDFSDPDVGDTQSSYQVIVSRDSDDVVIWDSGAVASTASVATCGVILTNGETYYWTARVSDGTAWSTPGGGDNIWYFTVNTAVNQPPNAPNTPSPADGEGGVSTSSALSWLCSDPDGDPLTYDVYLDTSNPPTTLIANDIAATSISPALAESTIYYWYVIASDGSLFTSGPAWIFATTGAYVPSGDLGLTPDGPNSNKTAVTETFNLEELDTAKLSFWHKYNMMPGANGGFMQIGYNVSGSWQWRYVIPANAYTGNLRASVIVNDSFDTRVFWCWNGISGQGTFDWEYVSVNLLNYVPTAYRDEVKVKFNYTQYGGGTGYGWYIDDVRVSVSRPDLVAPTTNSQDVWDLVNVSAVYGWDKAHSGYHAWSNIDPDDPTQLKLKAGIDNYLMSTPIDLTNAKTAYLSAYLKFNMNEDSGAPPDGFRVEVSKDNGVTWISINLGVRTSWGVSGTGNDADDGNVSDGKTYTGIGDSGEGAFLTDDYWVSMGTLSRVNIDLSSFSGNAIHVRFRMVTCGHGLYEHNNNHNQADPGFGGFYVDDVIVYGETILT